MDRKSALSKFDPTNTSFDEDIKSIIYYLASQADNSEWSLDNPWALSRLIIPLIRQNPTKSAVGKWIYPETQRIRESFFGTESFTKRENAVGVIPKKSMNAPQILKASLSEREIILQSLRPLSGRKTVLDKLRSRKARLKTDISSEKHELLGKKYGKRR